MKRVWTCRSLLLVAILALCARCDTVRQDPMPDPAGWLFTQGNRIYVSDGRGGGTAFRGRGANLQDTRGCVACLWDDSESPQEVMRRADVLIGQWGANFVRLTLESHAAGEQAHAKHGLGVLDDPDDLQDVVDIVRHMTSQGAYVLISLWLDPTFDDMGLPTRQTDEHWALLASTFAHDSHVLFGICNEPEENFEGAQDAAAWEAINRCAGIIRKAEAEAGAPRHVILAQGTGDWARRLEYYEDHPITAGGGGNIAYEIHYYNPISQLDELLAGPAATLPVVIGEFGPIRFDGGLEMTMQDCRSLMDFALANDVPFLAWTFHQNCAPNLIVNHVGEACGVGMKLEPTDWGRLLMEYLSKPW